jgi:cell division protein FtsL
MKKSAKPLIFFSSIVFIVFTSLILGYVSVKLECEKLRREENILTEERLKEIKDYRTNLIAQDQDLSAEETIVRIAETELGMIRRTDAPIELEVSKEKIEEISKAIEKKYE